MATYLIEVSQGVDRRHVYLFFVIRVHTYLIFRKKPAFLLKLITCMKPILITSEADIAQQIERCRLRINQCADVIKQLTGFTPKGFKFTFSVGDIEVVSFDVTDEGSNFTIGYFMSWHQFYSKQLAMLEKLL